MELVKDFIGLVRQANGWHALGVALAFVALVCMRELGLWAPSAEAASLLYPAATAAGLALGSAMSWFATTITSRLSIRAQLKFEREVVLEKLTHLNSSERAILGGYVHSGRKRHRVDTDHPSIISLRDLHLLEWEQSNIHSMPDQVWSVVKGKKQEFPAGNIPSPREAPSGYY